MKASTSIAACVAALALAGTAFAQQGTNSGNTGGGASTRTGAGVVTSGSAVPAGQQPRATDSTLGTAGGGTGAGMGNTPAGKTPDDVKADTGSKKKVAAKKKSKKKTTAAKKPAAAKQG